MKTQIVLNGKKFPNDNEVPKRDTRLTASRPKGWYHPP